MGVPDLGRLRFLCPVLLLPLGLPAETTISAADLQADLAILRSAYEALHPGLYRYNTKAAMDANFDLLAKDLNRPRTLKEAYLAIARFTAKVKCGHSYPNFYNQKQAVVDEVFGGRTRTPFEFEWMDGEMVVTRDLSGTGQLRPGLIVSRINGVPAKQVLDRLLEYARADGSNTNKRIDDLSFKGLSRYSAFDVYYPLLYPMKEAAYRLDTKDPLTSQKKIVTVPAWTLAERTAALAQASAPEGDAPVWQSKMLDHRTAYLRMTTWALYKSKWKWKDFLNAYMDDLIARGTPRLIIDLRGNEGGLDCGNAILSRLAAKDLNLAVYRRKVRYKRTPAELNQYLDTWDPSFRDWSAEAKEDSPGFYRLLETNGLDSPDVVKPAGPRYGGRVFVLMDASNSSATFQFEAALKRNALGRLVGQPAGGNLRGINGGAFFFLRLPKSGIEVDVPLIGRFPDSPQPDAPLVPDVYVARSAKDLARGIDAELLAASALE